MLGLNAGEFEVDRIMIIIIIMIIMRINIIIIIINVIIITLIIIMCVCYDIPPKNNPFLPTPHPYKQTSLEGPFMRGVVVGWVTPP